MDYGVLPPEINSGRIYAGPGSGSMLTAATAWEQLATELHSTAAMFDSVTSGLIAGPWTGPTATAMAAAAQPYVTWLRGTGAQAEQTARQATSAAQAYATAVAAVVPPPVIAANRALVHQLIAANFFGQNSPAIAEAERQYAEMWAQDAAAMYRYASSSAAASALTAFSRPPQTTNASGQVAQSLAVAQAGSAAATNDVGSIIGQISPFTGLATQMASAGMTSWSGTANMLSNINNGIGLVAFTAENPGGLDEILHPPFLGPASLGLGGLGLGGAGLSGAGLGGAGLSAGAGNALKIGALSVPHGWAMPATLSSAVTPAGMAVPAPAGPAFAGATPGTAFGETMLGTLAGRGLGAATARAASHRRTVVPRPPAAG
ncbi:PPE family protein [[Mycobacterium] nativiensis]|uniref:PPE family protein n=1 Tax=[Mycobacterium] nativiensis TaxID=2855503 RepID=A0ABU5XX09_9MYCO|nr:PPE domain-containing protein [Mycolicibacter sp. MYC340]MEB3032307.1 PPE family protein [Mycolicibacter sp. MYC340]